MSDSEEQITVINLEHSVHFMRSDGILEVVCTDGFYGLPELKQMNAAHKMLCKGQKVAMLIMVAEFSTLDKEGRDYMSAENEDSLTFAQAYVIKTLAQRMLANFYLKFNKPSVATRFFTKKEEAENWLTEEINKYAAGGLA